MKNDSSIGSLAELLNALSTLHLPASPVVVILLHFLRNDGRRGPAPLCPHSRALTSEVRERVRFFVLQFKAVKEKMFAVYSGSPQRNSKTRIEAEAFFPEGSPLSKGSCTAMSSISMIQKESLAPVVMHPGERPVSNNPDCVF